MKQPPKRRKEIPLRRNPEFPERNEEYPITYPPDYPGIPFPEEYPIEQQEPEIHRTEPFIDPFDEPLDGNTYL
jgi:hypothetical protein